MRLCLSVLALTVMLSGCQMLGGQDASNDTVLAQVGENSLMLSQVQNLLPYGSVDNDSVVFVQNYVDKWIHNQLMLEKAVKNIDDKGYANIENMVNDYRTALLVYKYQQMYIEQNLDTLILDSQIAEHYNNYGVNFLLDSCAVRSVFVQIPKSLPDGHKVKRLVRSDKPDDLVELEEFCYKNARSFDIGADWRYLSDAVAQMPAGSIADPKAFAKALKFAEAQDSIYNYYFSVVEFRDVNEQAPLVFAKDKIREILLNHRKNDLIKDLEINIYIDAVSKQRFTNYVN